MNTSAVKLRTKGLNSLKRMLADAEKSVVDVGIFADHNARDDGETNAEVGAKMEFGSIEESTASDAQLAARGRNYSPIWSGNPARSFLEMPLTTDLPHRVKDQGKLIVSTIIDPTLGPKDALAMIGEMGERSVAAAFDTEGFGEWPPNSEITKDWKGSDKPLIDSGQLRDSISSRVVAAPANPNPF